MCMAASMALAARSQARLIAADCEDDDGQVAGGHHRQDRDVAASAAVVPDRAAVGSRSLLQDLGAQPVPGGYLGDHFHGPVRRQDPAAVDPVAPAGYGWCVGGDAAGGP